MVGLALDGAFKMVFPHFVSESPEVRETASNAIVRVLEAVFGRQDADKNMAVMQSLEMVLDVLTGQGLSVRYKEGWVDIVNVATALFDVCGFF